MQVIPSNIFLLLAAALIALTIFPDRIRNRAAYRRAVISCIAVFAIHAVGITLLSFVGMPILDLVDIRGPGDLAQLSWVGFLIAGSWGAVAVSYWSAFRAASDLKPLRSGEKCTSKGRRKQGGGTRVYRAQDGKVTESAN